MKSIDEILENYSKYEKDGMIDNRFSKRFIDFLTDEQISANKEKLWYGFKEGVQREVKAWTEENVLDQLKKDVEFGWEKACDERGISSSLMAEVVMTWNRILENGLDDLEYYGYGKQIYLETAKRYGWELPKE